MNTGNGGPVGPHLAPSRSSGLSGVVSVDRWRVEHKGVPSSGLGVSSFQGDHLRMAYDKASEQARTNGWRVAVLVLGVAAVF